MPRIALGSGTGLLAATSRDDSLGTLRPVEVTAGQVRRFTDIEAHAVYWQPLRVNEPRLQRWARILVPLALRIAEAASGLPGQRKVILSPVDAQTWHDAPKLGGVGFLITVTVVTVAVTALLFIGAVAPLCVLGPMHIRLGVACAGQMLRPVLEVPRQGA